MTKGKGYTRYSAEFKRMFFLRASEDGSQISVFVNT